MRGTIVNTTRIIMAVCIVLMFKTEYATTFNTICIFAAFAASVVQMVLGDILLYKGRV